MKIFSVINRMPFTHRASIKAQFWYRCQNFTKSGHNGLGAETNFFDLRRQCDRKNYPQEVVDPENLRRRRNEFKF